jgi:hypothetical protein
LVIVVVELFHRGAVDTRINSDTSRTSCAESGVESGVEVRQILCGGQAGEAGNGKEREPHHICGRAGTKIQFEEEEIE